MPALHSLCLPPASTSLPSAAAAARATQTTSHWLASVPTRPLSLQTPDASLPLPLPDIPAHVKEKIICLEIMGVDSGRALAINPALRDAPLDAVHAVLSFLRSKGIHHKDLARILGMCPKVLTADVRTDLAPVFSFLSADLGVPDAGLRRAVNKCPRLLVSSVRDQLRPALFYLRRLGFRDNEALAYHDPVLLVSSVEKTLIPKLEFIMGTGLSREEAVGMVLRCPGLFTFSIENNFKPKYAYFVEEMGGTLEELKEFPQYFAFSLEKRIKPRHQEMAERGMRLSLSVMLKSTEEEFRELMQRDK